MGRHEEVLGSGADRLEQGGLLFGEAAIGSPRDDGVQLLRPSRVETPFENGLVGVPCLVEHEIPRVTHHPVEHGEGRWIDFDPITAGRTYRVDVHAGM